MSASETHNRANMRMTLRVVAGVASARSWRPVQAARRSTPPSRPRSAVRSKAAADREGGATSSSAISIWAWTASRSPTPPAWRIRARSSQLVGRGLDAGPGGRADAALPQHARLGLANVLAAYEAGARRFDAALGGLGGCPFAPGATGNICTEDLVNLCDEMGMRTGIDLPR